MSEKTETLIVDGHGVLFRMFYGVPINLRSKDGIPLNAVIGFIGAMLKYIGLFEPRRMVVIFDNAKPSFRNEIFPEYKLNRMIDYDELSDDENPFMQMPIIESLLDELGLKHCTHEGFEADDAMASYAQLSLGEPMTVVSNDTDLLQVVDQETSVFADRGKKSAIYTAEAVVEKFGVAPGNIVAYKSLTGDTSDNIPGLRGVGPKTAAKLIAQFGSIEEMIAREREIAPARLQETIAGNHGLLQRNKQLITLRRDVPLGFTLSDLEIDGPQYHGLRAIDVLASGGYL